MASHTITIYRRKSPREAKGQKTTISTSALNNLIKNANSSRNIPSISFNKQIFGRGISLNGLGGAAAVIFGAKKTISTGVNVFTTINSAASGEEISNNNLKAATNLILNPVQSARDILVQRFLGDLRVQRQNESLNYQRQLTGNLVYSKNFNNGTF
jgi:hypothetical protein